MRFICIFLILFLWKKVILAWSNLAETVFHNILMISATALVAPDLKTCRELNLKELHLGRGH